ncbi:tRNA-dihydrouridine(20) synthase [NAD(P)+] [Psilocybe cubensis]|uniref:tRNA-dihydrouridine(20) synthase [NAD(P)+] n=2 Tax=Psilocybe cubensis TaxID=181762 RepID=A0ACB8HF51_PSICU|nr:tRNA-dihydrouridine(20) synthase [NAD(P)+] [Psilocybe cubensis]KAH9486433.1 tRNA-dihydrouridine(20) synthase [NAD(P)+] [Psilocybe cubensis]
MHKLLSRISKLLSMSRRSLSPSSSPRPSKRAKMDHLTKEDFKNGVFLAPMVRSGALPTRLFALKHGATLVWGPEIVDKAILHSTREVDPVTGVVSYNGVSRAIFTTHPIEKPYLIYQMGSADPDLAVQAAKIVMQDISGIDLNCGCPKPFSTHAGMGAALLTNPDLLCAILVALREAMPSHITVTAKIRLLPSQEDTLKLVERIVNTGVSALTVHCRTRNMREKDRAVIERLREIVEFVEGMGKDIAVVENGDCKDWEDAKRVRAVTGAHSVMIARGAESNPSCFSPEPLKDVETTLIPAYLNLSKYLQNHWSLTKFCVGQFKGTRMQVTKADSLAMRQTLSQAKDYSDMEHLMTSLTGEQEFQQIIEAIEKKPPREHRMLLTEISLPHDEQDHEEKATTITPQGTQNPEPPGSGAPFLPNDTGKPHTKIPGHDATTPTPSGVLSLTSL